MQSDLARTLLDLHDRRAAGTAAYDRVLIETSGLSDPAPALQSLMTDGAVAAIHRLPYVVTLVDTVHGDATLRDHAEARQQVALADLVLVSKTDLLPLSDGLTAELDALNPGAPRGEAAHAAAADLFGDPAETALTGRLSRLVRAAPHAGIETFTVTRERPLPALALALLLQALAEHCGPRMLRLKGLIAIEEMPGRPAVVHGVRHVVSAPEFLERWPSGDRSTRMVFIGKGIPRHFVSRLLDAIEQEVREASLRA